MTPDRCTLTQPLLHIGYHKTGSTWLQTTVFSGPGSSFCLPWDRPTLNQHFLLQSPWEFDADRTRAALLARARRTRFGTVAVVSNENLSGNPYVGDFNAKLVAGRLHAVFPHSQVVIVIREQRAMIRSGYIQYVRAGGGASLAQYLDPPRGIHKAPVFTPESYLYDRIIHEYQSRFGRKAVLVLPFEWLASNTRRFVDAITEHSGAERLTHLSSARPQAALGPLTTLVKRHANRCFVRDAINPSPLVDAPLVGLIAERALVAADVRLPLRLRSLGAVRMERQLRSAQLPDYSESNRRIEKLTGLDLAALGYQ